ncbi:MAG: FIST N-terminal domain-containing protein [Roseobacter sp.]
MEQIASEPLSGVFLFVSPSFDFDDVVTAVSRFAPQTRVAACSTAGEIAADGYAEDTIVAIGFPASLFDISPIVVENLHGIDRNKLITKLIRSRAMMKSRNPDFAFEFGMLLPDGLSLGEESLMSALLPALGSLQIFGGSSGDGQRFERTRLYYNGQQLEGGSIIFLVRSRCKCHLFRIDNFTASSKRMVVTDADASARLVRRINDEPAAQEYARILGLEPHQLCLETFVANPLALRIGSSHYVRSILKLTPDGHLLFSCAIDEGMVLNLAVEALISEHLDSFLESLKTKEEPAMILGFDCLFRRLASAQNNCQEAVSRILAKHKMVGFSTYGEQYGTLHVNQTLVGAAIYPAAEF